MDVPADSGALQFDGEVVHLLEFAGADDVLSRYSKRTSSSPHSAVIASHRGTIMLRGINPGSRGLSARLARNASKA